MQCLIKHSLKGEIHSDCHLWQTLFLLSGFLFPIRRKRLPDGRFYDGASEQVDVGGVLLGLLLFGCGLWHTDMMPEPHVFR